MRFTSFKLPVFQQQPDAVQVVAGLVAISLAFSWVWGA